MRILRTVILSIGLAAVATACGGKSKSEETVPDNTGGEEATDDGTGGDTYGGEGGDMGHDPCADGMGHDPCGGGE